MRLAMMLASSLLALAPTVALAADASSETRPAPGLTKAQAIVTFGGAIMDCLQAVTDHQTVDGLGARAAVPVTPAAPADRKWASPGMPASEPVWITGQLGYLLNITQPSPARCEVHALQLPVDRTFRAVVYALSKATPDLKPVTVKPGFDPIVYQLESVTRGSRLVVHLEGAEPGTPGHALRFSLLYAWVEEAPQVR